MKKMQNQKSAILIALLLFSFISTNLIFAQSEYVGKENLNSDLTYFKDALYSSHPAVFKYSSKQHLDSLFLQSQFDSTQNCSYLELERRIRVIISDVMCVHTYLTRSLVSSLNDQMPLIFFVIIFIYVSFVLNFIYKFSKNLFCNWVAS
jgi:hypothetical protein